MGRNAGSACAHGSVAARPRRGAQFDRSRRCQRRTRARSRFPTPHTTNGSFTYMHGYYDSAVLEKLNWFLRDWRSNESTKMDPKLFPNILWQVYRESGSQRPVDVLSGYRSPQTTRWLRRRSPSGRGTFTAYEGRANRRAFPRRRHRRPFATSRCACRPAASDSTRPAGRRGFISTSGLGCVIGRGMSRDALTRFVP